MTGSLLWCFRAPGRGGVRATPAPSCGHHEDQTGDGDEGDEAREPDDVEDGGAVSSTVRGDAAPDDAASAGLFASPVGEVNR